MSVSRIQKDAYNPVNSGLPKHTKKYEWELPNAIKQKEGLKVRGHYIAKESTENGLIIRPFNPDTSLPESTNKIEILIPVDSTRTACWECFGLTTTLPVGAFRIVDTVKGVNIYVGKHKDEGVGRIELLDKKWVFVSQKGKQIGSDFEVLC